MVDTIEIIIVASIIGSTVFLLLMIALACLIRKYCIGRRRRKGDTENLNDTSESKNRLLNSKDLKFDGKSSPKLLKEKFLSVSLSEIPFIDDGYVSTTDLRLSKTCDAICS